MSEKPENTTSISNFHFCGIPISSIPSKEALEEYFVEIWENDANKKSVVYGFSMSVFPRFNENPKLYEYSKSYDLIVSDGVKFHKMGQRFGFPFKYMISVPQTVNFVLELAEKYKKSICILGATDEVLSIAESNLKSKGIKVLPGLNGYYKPEDEKDVIKYLNKMAPDILLLGMPTPKKEKFITDHKHKLDAKVTILCGGMIDIIAGKSKLANPFMKKLGLAGLYRAVQEPGRLFGRIFRLHSKILFYYFPLLYWEFMIKKNKSYSITRDLNISNQE